MRLARAAQSFVAIGLTHRRVQEIGGSINTSVVFRKTRSQGGVYPRGDSGEPLQFQDAAMDANDQGKLVVRRATTRSASQAARMRQNCVVS